MYIHHITRMAKDVIKAGLVPEDKKEELIGALSIEWKDKIAISWCMEDVHCRAKELGEVLTDAEVKEVLDEMLYRHDATIGICWDTFDIYIEDLVAERSDA